MPPINQKPQPQHNNRRPQQQQRKKQHPHHNPKVEKIIKAVEKKEQPRAPTRPPIRNQPAKSPLQASDNAMMTNALRMVAAETAPSLSPPVRFPTTGDLTVGTTPIATRRSVVVPFILNSTFDPANYYATVVITNDWTRPFMYSAAVSNAGQNTYTTIQYNDYANMTTNASLLRMNSNGMRLRNIGPLLYGNGRSFMAWQNANDAGSENIPTFISTVLGNPQIQVQPLLKLNPNQDFIPLKQNIENLQFRPPSTSTTASLGCCLIAVFVATAVAGSPPAGLEIDLTAHYEFVPKTNLANLFDTRAEPATAADLQRAKNSVEPSTVGSNSDPKIGVGADIKSVVHGISALARLAKPALSIGKKIVSGIASFLGLSDREHSQLCLAHLDFHETLTSIHQACPHIVDHNMYAKLLSAFWGLQHNGPHLRQDLTLDEIDRLIMLLCLSACQPSPLFTRHVRQRIGIKEPLSAEYGLVLPVVPLWTVLASKLYFNETWVCDLVSEGKETLIGALSEDASIFGGPIFPKLRFQYGAASVETALVCLTARQIFLTARSNYRKTRCVSVSTESWLVEEEPTSQIVVTPVAPANNNNVHSTVSSPRTLTSH